MTTLSLILVSDDTFASCMGEGRSWGALCLPNRLRTQHQQQGNGHQRMMLNGRRLDSSLFAVVVQRSNLFWCTSLSGDLLDSQSNLPKKKKKGGQAWWCTPLVPDFCRPISVCFRLAIAADMCVSVCVYSRVLRQGLVWPTLTSHLLSYPKLAVTSLYAFTSLVADILTQRS